MRLSPLRRAAVWIPFRQQFAVELANRFLDDRRFDFVDHILTVHVQADAQSEPFADKAIIAIRMYIASNCDDRSSNSVASAAISNQHMLPG